MFSSALRLAVLRNSTSTASNRSSIAAAAAAVSVSSATAAKAALLSTAASSMSSSSNAGGTKPSAFDVVVQLTFVDPNGARRQVPGMVGTYRDY